MMFAARHRSFWCWTFSSLDRRARLGFFPAMMAACALTAFMTTAAEPAHACEDSALACAVLEARENDPALANASARVALPLPANASDVATPAPAAIAPAPMPVAAPVAVEPFPATWKPIGPSTRRAMGRAMGRALGRSRVGGNSVVEIARTPQHVPISGVPASGPMAFSIQVDGVAVPHYQAAVPAGPVWAFRPVSLVDPRITQGAALRLRPGDDTLNATTSTQIAQNPAGTAAGAEQLPPDWDGVSPVEVARQASTSLGLPEPPSGYSWILVPAEIPTDPATRVAGVGAPPGFGGPRTPLNGVASLAVPNGGQGGTPAIVGGAVGGPALGGPSLNGAGGQAGASPVAIRGIRNPAAAGALPRGGLKPSSPSLPFRISVDGEPIFGARPQAVPLNQLDTPAEALNELDVDISYTKAEVGPHLSVVASHTVAGPRDIVAFYGYSNYARWIARGEILVYTDADTERASPYAVIPLDWKLQAQWSVAGLAADEVRYVMRVYDREGNYDETSAKQLLISQDGGIRHDGRSFHVEARENLWQAGTIPLRGGAVLVTGGGIPDGFNPWVMGYPAPLEDDGGFAWSQIVPPGTHDIHVGVLDQEGEGLEFRRNIYVPDDNWFYVALADLTIGQNSVTGPAELVTQDQRFNEDVYVNGRLAFYVKGKIQGKYLLTASADTEEGPIDELFDNFLAKDPRRLLRRIDPDRFYPVYADGSTLVEDAPTAGKLFVRLEAGENSIMWGSFQTRITGTDFAQIDRSLYGARVVLATEEEMEFGEKRAQLTAFAADPGTISAREEFRGTGGSLFFLRRQDLVSGSDRVRIEIRDQDSGIVLQANELSPGTDYDIDPIQGRLVLSVPVPSTADNSQLVQAGSLSGNPVFVVVRYEYSPSFDDPSNLTYGGRGEVWLTDWFKLGASGLKQNEDGRDLNLIAGDATLRFGEGTYLRAELARSEGTGGEELASLDGGFSFSTIPVGTAADEKALAARIEGAVDLEDMLGGGWEGGQAVFYVERREKGFSAPGQLTEDDTNRGGLAATLPLGETTKVALKVDGEEIDARSSSVTASGDVTEQINDRLAVSIGTRYERSETETVDATAGDTNARGDVGVRLTYQGGDEWEVFAFGQGTVLTEGDAQRNDRFGIGGRVALTDKITLDGQLSGGSTGVGARAGLEYAVDEKSTTYVSYELAPRDTGSGSGLLANQATFTSATGRLVVGNRTRYSDTFSVYGEQRYDTGGENAVTHSYGGDWKPLNGFSFGASFETGTIEDDVAGRLDRTGFAMSAGYETDGLRWTSALEARFEEREGEDNRVWLVRNNLVAELNPDWSLVSKLDFAVGDGSDSSLFAGGFTEASLGFGYRPVLDGRLNALLKYTYFQDEPTTGQVSPSGVSSNYEQRSHILSADAVYALHPRFSIGGKYGLRFSELREARGEGEFFSSATHLGVVRTDWEMLRRWSLVAEGRILANDAAEDRRIGSLVAVYRRLGENFRLGAGYNFSDFSDDLTNQDYTSNGWFINATGKF